MRTYLRNPIFLGLLSSVLLDLPFPIAGPMPPWRAVFSWIALVPLLYGLLGQRNVAGPRYLRRSALAGYGCGVFWYILNCYWIYDTMHLYGGVPPAGAFGILVLYSLVLGLYFAVFGFLIALCRKAFRTNLFPLVLAPFFWAALEFAASRITSVPWDQLGYAQVDNFLLTRLAPFTGVYGISFVLVAGNALFAAALLTSSLHMRLRIGVGAILFAILLQLGSFSAPKPVATSDYAVLLQPNLDVAVNQAWIGPEWDEHVSWIMEQSQRNCTPAITGMPTRQSAVARQNCGQNTPPPGIVAWPEAPSPFVSDDPRTIALLRSVATANNAPVVAGMFGHDATGTYNSGVFTAPDGNVLGRYDKIHLVPFGEFVPYRDVFFFAKKLTQQLVDLQRGQYRKVFRANGHTFGIFICYESVFADEVRQFAVNGAQVFVNISDDGWYGDTSAPWQHLNMARMRAIENRRWILRDTNNGVTTAIDPAGHVTLSAARHAETTLVVRYGYNDDLTFYTRYGDLFAILCGIITIVAVAMALRPTLRVNLRI
ncbi:apolipoprotein N-acyltransferase [Alloacidobacterium dinghuense]|uniref:Apolipoprotein N-acyltransferase n=1 Tax=Alloacidobacterium dinghuense TaxID=2763107 RepID=A0A7G8BCE9_9BACT|nr:apolipoprotein N-acyltransferase [Alloacidobacterium dinghuense]QNI30219.1 apolipoprotein N-acyltransferase [Alloacidobacterium dinghuense]